MRRFATVLCDEHVSERERECVHCMAATKMGRKPILINCVAAIYEGKREGLCHVNMPCPNMSLNSHQSLHTTERYCSLFFHCITSYKGLKPYNTFQSL
ncbi:hypothetical protein VNO77_25264 [Canavalia gladiata]|uniref:Uncharacterized protein n=1 Tax=Canavalia gladiata TaxID=3824 RepID=A0AAN9QGY8_CANGL